MTRHVARSARSSIVCGCLAVVGVWSFVGIGGTTSAGAGPAGGATSLLPADALAYLRWDGLSAHQEAWQQTALYGALYETTLGEFVADGLDALVEAAGQRGGPPGAPSPAEALELLEHVVEYGVTAAVRVDPQARPRGAHAAGPPAVEITAVFHQAGQGRSYRSFSRILGATFREGPWKPEDVAGGDRDITQLVGRGEMRIAWWVEGEDLVVTFGSEGAEAVLATLEGERPNIGENPLLGRYGEGDGFEQIAVLWVDGARLRELVQAIPVVGPAGQGGEGVQLSTVLEVMGLDQVESLAVQWGFAGRALQTVSTLEAPSPRRGILSLFDQEPFALDELPPLPAEGGFTAFSLDWGALYDEVLATVDRVGEAAGPEFRDRFEQGLAHTERMLGFDIREDLLAHLGHRAVLYSEDGSGMAALLLPAMLFMPRAAASEQTAPAPQAVPEPGLMELAMAGGVGGLNTALAIEVEDADALADTLNELEDQLVEMSGGRLQIERSEFRGTTLRVYRIEQGGMPLRPTVALTDDWLIIGTFPQPVQALLLRQAGELPVWEPTGEVEDMLADLPDEVTSITVTDLRPLVETVLDFAPLLASLADSGVPQVDLDVSLIPPAEQVTAHLFPNVSVRIDSEDGVRWISRSSLPGPMDVVGGPVTGAAVMAGLLLPAVQQAREAARRAQCRSNLHQIGLAMHNYYNVHRRLPTQASYSEDGEPLLSWRVELLPYLDQAPLYNQFRMDEPWDSPHNRELIAQMPEVFRCPSQGTSEEGLTTYLAPVGESTVFRDDGEPVGFQHITDGTSNTILIVEASDDQAVVWTRPDDLDYNAEDPLAGLAGGHHRGGFHVVMGDSSVRFVSQAIDPETLRALFTRDGREVIGEF